MINKLIIGLLKKVGVPVCFQRYSGEEKTYITFHEYHQSGEIFEEDIERYTGHYIQIDVWSKRDYTEIVYKVKQILKENEFKRLDEADLFEKKTGVYHKGMKFYFLEEREELECQDK